MLRRAIELDEGNAVAFSGLASLALSRHRFGEALVLARRARALAPTEARTLGAIGDALVELGRYRKAFATFDKLARLKPGLAAYARVSYARELLGDRPGAIAAMRLAAETAVPGSEAAAWTALQLGKLFNSGGDHTSAERQFRIALAHVPGYAAAFDGLASVEAARKRLSRAISLERRAVAAVPLPQYVATLGDLLQRAGRPRAAARQYSVVDAIDRVQRASGVNTDLELALFRIDHDRGLAAATRQALAAYRSRPSIDAADVVAWGLARSGRCVEAKRYSKLALRLGTEDSLKFFHRGMIERCLGNGVPREALAEARARPQSWRFLHVVAGSGEARTMKRLRPSSRCLARSPCRRSRRPTRSATSRSTTRARSSCPGTARTCTTSSTWRRSPRSRSGRIDVTSLQPEARARRSNGRTAAER